ncbi:hypothetical protein HJ588_17375 [Flexivirga sp. ID2601S]|uniref:Uncharacterized protein n=1 Tax=Flexivirga aerilata TaxID=1656889 RepID=A0A849AWI6_9MICO|nr:hypothetical protein [Flexivirga aerilata]NNG41032.1 hypothetical protein [Flexivirga aerilata]
MSDYQTKTRTTARAAAGIVATARAGAKAWQDGKLTHAYADTMVTEAEEDIGSVVSTFDSRQPPTQAAIALRDRIDAPLESASNALSDLRIALRRSDHEGVKSATDDLAAPQRSLEGLEQVGL